MLTQQKKPFNTSSKLLPLNESVVRQYDNMTKSRSSKIMSSEELEKKFTQLYLENEKWSEKKKKLREEKEQLEKKREKQVCTFYPKLNPEIEAFMTKGSGSFLKRENDWVSKKEKKIKELQTQSDKKLKNQCSFHPKISKKSNSLLFKNKNSQKKIQNSEREEDKNLSTSRAVNGSYRLIHEKKDSYRELRKTTSFKTFTLMTERRYLERLEQQAFQQKAPNATQQNSPQQSVQQQFSFSSINLPYMSQQVTNQPSQYDYIENIVIKTQQQDTFNSLSSLEMRSERKVENEEIKNQIFEEEVQQESEPSANQIEQNQEQGSHLSEDYSYQQNDDKISSQQKSELSDQQSNQIAQIEEQKSKQQNDIQISNNI